MRSVSSGKIILPYDKLRISFGFIKTLSSIYDTACFRGNANFSQKRYDPKYVIVDSEMGKTCFKYEKCQNYYTGQKKNQER